MVAILPYLGIAIFTAAIVLIVSRVSRLGVLFYGLLMLLVLAAAVEVMGYPRPIWTEWRNQDTLEVLHAQYVPDEAIYVWVAGSPPVSYVLPWDKRTAKEMQDAKRAGARYSVEYWNGRYRVHTAPVPELPPKDMK